jgi:hypothetical protein
MRVLQFVQGGLKKIRLRGRGVTEKCWQIFDDLARVLFMALALKPAAVLLSRKHALAVAKWCGLVVIHIPTSGKPALRTMKQAFMMEDGEAWLCAREYLAQPFYSFVIYSRLLSGRESTGEWKIEEKNNCEVVQLRESGRSFIVATGHFRRDSHILLYDRRICPGKVVAVTVPLPPKSLKPKYIKLSLQFGQMLRTLKRVRPDVVLTHVDNGEPIMHKLKSNLKDSGCQVVISADAFLPSTGRHAHTRAFGGMAARSFRMGFATLCRLTQCPIVPCVTYIDGDGTCIVEWGSVIQPPNRSSIKADVENGDAILDYLEGAVGRRPAQYALYIGEERKWNRLSQAWESRV